MSGMPEHKAAIKWLNDALADTDATLIVCETTILAFLRITTNRKVFSPALGTDEARKFVNGLLGHPRVQLFRPTAEHFTALFDLIKKYAFHGNLTMDAHLAAIALATGAKIVTCDADFKKIRYLNVIEPS